MRAVVHEVRERENRQCEGQAAGTTRRRPALGRASRTAAAAGRSERDGRDEVGEPVRAVEVDDRSDVAVPEDHLEVQRPTGAAQRPTVAPSHATNTPRRMPARPSPMHGA